MPDIVIIYDGDDKPVVGKLVSYLTEKWDAWWAEDLNHGDWETSVRDQIKQTKAVIPVISSNIQDNNIFKDELKFASKKKCIIFPFVIEQAEIPFGFGGLNRTEAFGWAGEKDDLGYKSLVRKVSDEFEKLKCKTKRLPNIKLNGKTLKLPCFIFSLSSHETQLPPKKGVELLQFLAPSASLISAYDVWKFQKDTKYINRVNKLRNSQNILFLDSGNYEASRREDYYSNENKDGWRKKRYQQMANKISPDMAFAYDETNPKGNIKKVIKSIVDNYNADKQEITNPKIALCPVVHLPRAYKCPLSECASDIITQLADELKPPLIAIPERELGNGLLERIETVHSIRKALNGLNRYYPLHLLGTGNPISIISFAVAGADSFDGLEWCRTCVDYANGNLFHFQHLDCFYKQYLSRFQSKFRPIIGDEEAPYPVRVACNNFDYFSGLTRYMQNMIHSGQEEHLLNSVVPNIGTKIFEEITK